MSEVKRYITCSELPADIPDVVVCATDYAALEGKYSRICESLKDSDAGMHLFLEQRNELRAEIAASDQALRESRANEVAATHMLAEVQQELAALKVGQDVAQHQYLSRGETARWWNIEESDVARAKEEGLEVRKLYARPLPQPSASALVEALISGFEILTHDDRVPNEVSQECAAVIIQARKALSAYEDKP